MFGPVDDTVAALALAPAGRHEPPLKTAAAPAAIIASAVFRHPVARVPA